MNPFPRWRCKVKPSKKNLLAHLCRLINRDYRVGRGASLWTFFVALLAASPASSAEDWETSAWEAVSRMEFNDTYVQLINDPENATSRNSLLLQGIVLPNVQPVTASNFAAAIRLLEEAARPDPQDDIGAKARYFRARLISHNPFAPDAGEAARLYRELIADRPDALHAQLAVTKLALLRLYLIDPGDSRQSVLEELEKFGPLMTHADPSRAYHNLMGVAYLRFGLSSQRALHHLNAARRIGFTDATARARILVQIAVLAEDLGYMDLARDATLELLAFAPRDARARYLRERFGLRTPESIE